MAVAVTTEQSIENLFNTLKIYEEATNAKINIDKTEALWVGKWKNNIHKPLGLKWVNDMVKFVGTYIGNNRDDASGQSFSEIIDSIKNKVSYWNTKSISIKGKIKIVNTFVLSKLWYVLETHNLSDSLLLDIKNIIKAFIWKGHKQVSYEILCLPFDKGGLSLQNIQIRQDILRLKWLAKLLSQDTIKTEKSVVDQIFRISYPQIGIRVLMNQDLKTNSLDTKFYKKATKVWTKANIIFKPKNANSIKHDWIYSNPLLTDVNRNTFKYPGYFVNRDLPNYVPLYFKNLPVQVPMRDLRGIFKNLIPNLNRAVNMITFTNLNEDTYEIEVADRKIDLSNSSFKSLYQEVIRNQTSNITCQPKWELELDITNMDWTELWLNIHKCTDNYKIESSIWQMVHRNFICSYFLKKIYNTDGKCKLCGQIELNRTHIFMNCNIIKYIYHNFDEIIRKMVNIDLSPMEMAFGIFNNDSNKAILRNYITFAIRHIIFINRNKEFESQTLCKHILLRKTKSFIKKDLEDKLNIFKAKNNCPKFEQKYLIDNILGKIENDKLIVNF